MEKLMIMVIGEMPLEEHANRVEKALKLYRETSDAKELAANCLFFTTKYGMQKGGRTPAEEADRIEKGIKSMKFFETDEN